MKLYTDNAHMNHYEGWGMMGNDGERDYYIKKLSNGNIYLSIVHSDEDSDYSSPCFETLQKNLKHFWNSPCKGYKELVKRLAAYGHLPSNSVIDSKTHSETGKPLQLRIDGKVYVNLGCGWFKSLELTEQSFNAL